MMRIVCKTICLYLAVVSPVTAQAPEEPVDPEPFSSALQESIRLQEEIDRYNSQIADLESELGPFDQNLLESLQGLSGALIDALDFEEANRVLERRLQLIRTLEGPASTSQLPVIEEAIANDIRRQDWDSITDRFEFIFWLKSQAQDIDTAGQLEARELVLLWHLTAVSLDAPVDRIRHLQEAREHLRQGLGLAEDTFAEDSLDLAHWYYREALLKYQVASFLVSEDELGYYAVQDIAQIEARGPSDFMREGLNTVKRIRDIMELRGDPEAEAMAMIYEADFQMIMDLGTAARLYREAMDKLLEAGISSQQIDAFFERPISLPVPQLHTSLADAVAAHDAMGFVAATEEGGMTDLGRFVAWNESLPFTRRPAIPAAAITAADYIPLHEIVLEFDLNSRGTTRNPTIIESSTDSARVRNEAREAIRDMRFRPRFEDRRWRRMEDLRITYAVPPQL